MSEIKKVVLAYSGGLDTSIIIPWLKEHYDNCEVIAVCGNVGQKGELEGLEERAKASGASKLYIEDLTDEFVEDYVIPTMQAGADYEGYLLGTSFARPILAKRVVEIARAEGADAVCHGSTGKGNDQVRFELAIEARGVEVSPKNLKLSDKATISMPWHKVQDGLEEDRLAQKGSAFGSTRRGIAYAYSDKYRKKTLRLGDLLHLDEKRTQNRLRVILDSKNMELAGCYHQEKMSYDALLNWCKLQAEHFTPYICDVGTFLQQAHDSGKRIVLEAQLGAMRDIDYGIFPFTSSSNTLAAYAPLGAGIPNCKLDHVVGVLKSYSTCVGAGPFAAENAMGEEWNEKLRKAGGEYGAATGRPRRVGPFDCVASRYGLACQGADKIALTKLDVLSSMKEIPVITGYKLDGVKVPRFDTLSDLDRMEPVVTMLPGWNTDISGCKSWDDLPKEAKAYVEFLEKELNHEIQFVSTGAEREKFVLKGEWL